MTTYAILRPDDGSTLHAHERRFAEQFCDETLYLRPDGLHGDHDGDLHEADPDELATATYVSIQDCRWILTDHTYVLLGPDLLDRETGNVFRPSLRHVFERADPQEHFPYLDLDGVGQRAAWLIDCIETGEIVPTTEIRRHGVTGVDDGQSDLGSF